MRDFLKNDEVLEDLQTDDLKIIQKTNGFRFGIDAVLLSDFVSTDPKSKVLDIGTGTGIMPLLMVARGKSDCVTGLEIQAEMADMAKRSVQMNNLEGKIQIIQGDIKKWDRYFKKNQFDSIVTNPPYMENGTGLVNASDHKALSRHEIACTLQDVVEAARQLLRPGGSLNMVHRPQRLVDIMVLLRDAKIEPKFIRFVYSKVDSVPKLLLINAVKNGNRQLKFYPNLYVFDEEGRYTSEIDRIYRR